MDESQCAVSQIRSLGFEPEAVRDIVLTHLDVDHVGGISDFPWAAVHVMRDEYRAGFERPSHFERGRYKRLDWARSARMECYNTDGALWQGFECVRGLRGLPPEILLVPLRGHTRGHAGVAVHGDDGWLLHCGDAYFHYGQLEERYHCPPALRVFQRVCFDNTARLRNEARLRALSAQNDTRIEIFCAHDRREYEAASGEKPARRARAWPRQSTRDA